MESQNDAPRYRIEAIAANGIVKGWRIVRPDGAALLPFTLRREAEQLVQFFGEEEKS